MKRLRFTEEQIIGVLKEAEAGATAYGGLEVSEAKRLRALEDENAKLKRLLAETMLDNAGLKDLLAKNW